MFHYYCFLNYTYNYFLGYVTELFERLHHYVATGKTPVYHEKQVPSMASQGPSYTSLDELQHKMEERRRGLAVKPHYLPLQQLEEARQKTAKAKRTMERKRKKQ